jgi:fructuronate reductase
MQARLHPSQIDTLPQSVRRPAFDRRALRTGIVHLGLGAFARAHLAAVNDDALDAGAALDWGLHGVSLRHADVRGALVPQQGLYSLGLRDAAGVQTRIIGSVVSCAVAPEDPQAVVGAIAHDDTRVVGLTVTEKGYCHDPVTRALNFDHPDIAHDLAQAIEPRSAIGFCVRGLQVRRDHDGRPLTLLSLDNLPANGDTLRGLVLAFAERVDASLARWIERECTFPNSMVDRIVPRTTEADLANTAQALGVDDRAAVVAEPFLAWAVEDRFAAGRPDWSVGGAQFVERAEPFEKLKLRMLNGAHSAIAYLGVLAGWATVDAAMAQPALARFVDTLLRDEVAPTLRASLAGFDLDAYRAQLLLRFANPALAHRTLQIAMDGSQKLPQRWLGTVRDRLAAGAPIDRLALALAAWCMHLRGHDAAGRCFTLDDPLAAELAALHARAMSLPTPRERAAEFTRFAPVFGDLADEPRLVDALARALDGLQTRGVVAALERCAHACDSLTPTLSPGYGGEGAVPLPLPPGGRGLG